MLKIITASGSIIAVALFLTIACLGLFALGAMVAANAGLL